MILSYSSLLVSALVSNFVFLFIKVLVYLSSKKNYMISIRTLIWVSLIFLIRLIFPFEFPHTITIKSDFLLPNLIYMSRISILNIFHIEITLGKLLLLVWSFGFAVNLFRLWTNNRRFYTYLTLLQTVEEGTFIIHNKIFRKPVSFKVLQSPNIVSPLVIGFFKPIIVIPSNCLTSLEKGYVITHELIHFSKFDIWLKLFLEIFSAFYWWNPAIYYFKEQFTRLLEIRVDDELTKSKSELQKLEYVTTLINMKKYHQKLSFIPPNSLSFVGHKTSDFILRINILMNRVSNDEKMIKFPFLYLAISVFIFSLTLIVFEPFMPDKDFYDNSFSIDSENAFLIKEDNGQYSLHIDGEYKGLIENLNDMPSLKIIE